MILMRGNMWDSHHAVKLFTGNSTITKEDRLVMGRGAALQAREKFPNCDLAFGRVILNHHKMYGNKPYGVLLHPDQYNPILGVFQVKDFWSLPAKLELIVSSVDVLRRLARDDWKHDFIDLNFPGIKNGKLLREDVLPLLQRLPHNVFVWEES